MSVRRSTITNLAGFVKTVMKMGSPHKKWPSILQLPGDIRDPDEAKFKPNLVVYQVPCVCVCVLGRKFE